MKDLFRSAIFAVQFLTRIPVLVSLELKDTTAGKSLMFFPLVGWLAGSLLFAMYWLINLTGEFSSFTIAMIIVTAETMLTGAFHLDGLADTFDAFLSRATTSEEKLSIMKDSRIGVMGATALILSLLLKTTLLSELFSIHAASVLIIYPAVGRWVQVVFYVFSPYVRKEGIGFMFAKTADIKTLILATFWILPAFAFLSFTFVYIIILLIIFFCAYRCYVHKHIGGITGDILGSATVLSEIVFLTGSVIFVI